MPETRTGPQRNTIQALGRVLLSAAFMLTACSPITTQRVEATPTTVGSGVCIPVNIVPEFPPGKGLMEAYLPPEVEGKTVTYYVFVVWDLSEWSEETGEQGTIFVERIGSGGRTLPIIASDFSLSHFHACTDLQSAQRKAGKIFGEMKRDKNAEPSGGIRVDEYDDFMDGILNPRPPLDGA